jgi:hypothetical protein
MNTYFSSRLIHRQYLSFWYSSNIPMRIRCWHDRDKQQTMCDSRTSAASSTTTGIENVYNQKLSSNTSILDGFVSVLNPVTIYSSSIPFWLWCLLDQCYRQLKWRFEFVTGTHAVTSKYPPVTYFWTVPLILDHSYFVGNLTNSKIAETKALEPLILTLLGLQML